MKRKIKPFLLITLLISLHTILFSKNDPLVIFGFVKDITTDKSVEGAVVWVMDSINERPEYQWITNKDGLFKLPKYNRKFKIIISHLGYEPFQKTFDPLTMDSIPILYIKPSSDKLEEVVIVGEKSHPVIEQKAGGLVFNVENTISAQGSNALEVLKYTPGVAVDGNNSISINGQYDVQILLDGKPTYMQKKEVVDLLKSTASSNIKSIEVLPNGDAKYDASGTEGILNIVMKKSNKKGFNISINNGTAYGLSAKQNTELSFNIGVGKVNIYGNYNHNFGNYEMRYGGKR